MLPFIHTFKSMEDDIYRQVRNISNHLPSFKPDYICDMEQTHSTNIASVENISKDMTLRNSDGLYTESTSIALVIKTADCIPLVISNKSGDFILAAHLGWRGLHQSFVNQLLKFLSPYSKVGDLTAHIGPSIRRCCYSFSDEPTQSKDPAWQPFITKKGSKWHIDLSGFTKSQLELKGLSPKNIIDNGICTYHNREHFSHLRSKNTGESSGTMLTVVQLE